MASSLIIRIQKVQLKPLNLSFRFMWTLPTLLFNCNLYFITSIDNFTRFIVIAFLHNKTSQFVYPYSSITTNVWKTNSINPLPPYKQTMEKNTLHTFLKITSSDTKFINISLCHSIHSKMDLLSARIAMSWIFLIAC